MSIFETLTISFLFFCSSKKLTINEALAYLDELERQEAVVDAIYIEPPDPHQDTDEVYLCTT